MNSRVLEVVDGGFLIFGGAEPRHPFFKNVKNQRIDLKDDDVGP